MGDDGTFRIPAVPQPVRIRRDVNNLPAGDRTLEWYERAIQVMKLKALTDPLSWRYQSAIHDLDPAAVPAAQRDFWRKCQHSSWFFIPWHRMYIHYFEKTVATLVAAMKDGPTDWALPYWNYSATASAANPTPARLPDAFRRVTKDGENKGALYVPERRAEANEGQPFMSGRETNLNCLLARTFGRPNPPLPNFGGPKLLSHGLGGDSGTLENVPHNLVHNAVGGNTGFMTDPTTAPLDPIFWLHHCNIDRLWEVWVQRQKQQGNLDRNPKPQTPPLLASWQEMTFKFHDENGSVVDMPVSKVVDTRAAPLSYEYEDTSDPFQGRQ